MKTYLLLIGLLISLNSWSQDNYTSDNSEFEHFSGLKNSVETTKSKAIYSNAYDDNNPFVELFVEIGVSITYGILFETFWEKDLPMHDAQFTKYPYFDNRSGNYTYDERADNPFKLVLKGSLFAENNHLYGNNFEAKIKLLSRIDFSAGYSSFSESENTIPFYDMMFHYHRIRTPKLDIWYGFGAMRLGGNIEESGLSLDFGAEWFVKKPISVSAKWQYGFFDNSLTVRKNEFLLKYYLKQFNINFGAVNYKFDTNKINTLSIGAQIYL